VAGRADDEWRAGVVIPSAEVAGQSSLSLEFLERTRSEVRTSLGPVAAEGNEQARQPQPVRQTTTLVARRAAHLAARCVEIVRPGRKPVRVGEEAGQVAYLEAALLVLRAEEGGAMPTLHLAIALQAESRIRLIHAVTSREKTPEPI